MSLQCPCKIEFKPTGESDRVTLVDVGGWVTSPPRWSGDQNLFEAEGVRAANGYFKPLGGVTVSLTFETETDMDSHAEALAAFASPELIGGVDVMSTDGTIYITSDERITTYTNAVITNIKPGLPFGPESSVTRSFSVTASIPTSALIGPS